jgi:hypothetical protein
MCFVIPGCESYPSDRHPGGKGGRTEFKGNLPTDQPSESDWDRVIQSIAEDAPIPYDPNDPDDGPYDPNDDAAVDAFVTEAEIWAGYPNQVLIKPAGQRLNLDESESDAGNEQEKKAS